MRAYTCQQSGDLFKGWVELSSIAAALAVYLEC